jgi:phosphoglucosamine mutase
VVRSTGADLGLAHDGDADRIAAVDEKGRVVGWDKLLALASAHAVEGVRGKVVTTVDASMVVDERVAAVGGSVVRTRVGDVAVAQAVKTNQAVFGGEPSGAWIYPDVHLCSDGPLAGARILELMDEAAKPFSELADEVPEYPIVREKVRCPNEKKAAVMKKASARAKKVFKDVEDVSTVDGVRLVLGYGSWVLIRPSGTEPFMRITAEAKTVERANALVRAAKKLIGR